jgi:ATP-binding cassette subfamily C protein
MQSPTAIENLAKLVRRLLAFTGWRALVIVSLMLAAALSEGFGLLLLIPLLSAVGAMQNNEPGSGLTVPVDALRARLGADLLLEQLLLMFLAIIVVRLLVVYWNTRLTADTRVGFVADLRKQLFSEAGMTSWRHLQGQTLDKVGQVLLIDSWRIGEAALHLVRALTGVVLLLANVVVAVLISPVISLILLSAIVLLALIFNRRLLAVPAQGIAITAVQDELYRRVTDLLGNLRSARVSGATDHLNHEFGQTVDALSDRLSAFVGSTEYTRISMQLGGAVLITIALIVAIRGFDAGGPMLLVMVLITARLVPRVSAISLDLHRLAYDLPAFANAQSVQADLNEHCEIAATGDAVPEFDSRIEIDRVTVSAIDDATESRLESVSLQIRKHEMLALTGPSGVGKTTLADVIAGLISPDEGDVRVDGETLNAAMLPAWRKHVGYVSQSSPLLQGTMLHNLTWVLESDPGEQARERAMQCAAIDQVVAGLPDGLQTVVGRHEGRLSGGERQRLAIARELLREPRLLILDEATNALDIETEGLVLNNLRNFYPDLTILVVAHRQSAIERADRVVAMGGKN